MTTKLIAYTDPALIIYLDDRRLRVAEVIGEAQHVTGGFPLLALALQKIAAMGPDWPLAVVEALIASVVLVIFARDMRGLLHKPQGHSPTSHAGVGWFDIAAGALLIFEAFHGHHVKPGYLRPPFIAGATTLVAGLVHGRIHAFRIRRHYLKLDVNGLECRPGPFRRVAFAWATLASVEVSEKEAIFRTKSGQRRIVRLNRYGNRDVIRNAIMDHARGAGLLPPLN